MTEEQDLDRWESDGGYSPAPVKSDESEERAKRDVQGNQYNLTGRWL